MYSARTSRQPGQYGRKAANFFVHYVDGICGNFSQPGRQPRQKLFSQVILPGPPWCSAATDVDDTECDNNNNITIYKAHNVRKELNLRRRQSLGGGKSNSV